MKIFTQEILARKKIILIFILAILIPSLIVGYLSLNTFAKRREAVKRLLESNLWISGEAALKSIEEELLNYEKEALKSENFIRLIQPIETGETLSSSSILSKSIAGKLFLLDAKYQITFPKTGSEYVSVFQWEKNVPESQFARTFQRAEAVEFSQKNYSQAAELYQKCALSAPSKQYQAIALEGWGRCLLSSKKYDKAYEVYSQLSTKYEQFQNKTGHPYGIIAVFQLYEIDQRQKKEENSLKILLVLYEKIRNGVWLINSSAYDFFMAEIELILNNKLVEAEFPEIQKSYHALRKQSSPYRQALVFTNFLKNKVVPKIKERATLSQMVDEAVPGRFLTPLGEDICLISYTVLPDFQAEHTFYGGFWWDVDPLKKEIIPKLLQDITKDSGLHFQIIDESGRNILTGKKELPSEGSLNLSYRQFPLPWKFVVSQPGLKALEKTALRETFLYGILFSVIVILMLLGVFLIVRDISREAETSRLKTEFVRNVSHELKTPLTLIRLYGETLQRKEDLKKEERQESYEIITKESERLSHLINNVLDFSRIEMGKKEFNFKKGNLTRAVSETLESYRYHLEKKGFTIQADIASGLPQMNFDSEAIASVLVNLLSNAMKFSPKQKEVTVKLFSEGGNAILQVADKGIGISPKEVSRIFQRFYRSKNKITSETGGSGLGLTLVKHITEAHGGQVKVESEPGKGSIFSVILPLSGPKRVKT